MIALRALGVLCGGVLLAAMMGCPGPDDDGGDDDGSGASGASTPTSSSTGMGGSGGDGGNAPPLTCNEEYTDMDETACNLLAQDCPAGSWCNVAASGTASVCVPDNGGLKGKGEDCASEAECMAGLQCSNDKCTPVCCPGTNEPCEGGTCDIQLGFPGGGGYIMVCSYLQACNLFMDECPMGFDCHISDAEAGLAVCDEASANLVPEGGACMFRNDCGESQLCSFNAPDNGVCRHLCDTTIAATAEPGLGGCLPDRTCMAAGGTAFPNLGICIP